MKYLFLLWQKWCYSEYDIEWWCSSVSHPARPGQHDSAQLHLALTAMQSVQLLQSRFSYNEIWWPQTHSPTLDMDICTFIHWSRSNTVNCKWMCDIIELMKLYKRTKMWQKWHISRFNKLRPTKLAHGWIFVDMGALLPFKILFH